VRVGAAADDAGFLLEKIVIHGYRMTLLISAALQTKMSKLLQPTHEEKEQDVRNGNEAIHQEEEKFDNGTRARRPRLKADTDPVGHY
jgi:hypothetical protein